jgi:hypothetical protein
MECVWCLLSCPRRALNKEANHVIATQFFPTTSTLSGCVARLWSRTAEGGEKGAVFTCCAMLVSQTRVWGKQSSPGPAWAKQSLPSSETCLADLHRHGWKLCLSPHPYAFPMAPPSNAALATPTYLLARYTRWYLLCGTPLA